MVFLLLLGGLVVVFWSFVQGGTGSDTTDQGDARDRYGSTVSRWTDLANDAALAHGVRSTVLLSIVAQESGGERVGLHPDGVSFGLLGLTPIALEDIGVTKDHTSLTPAEQFDHAADFLALLKTREGSLFEALKWYHSGVSGGRSYAVQVLQRAGLGRLIPGGVGTDEPGAVTPGPGGGLVTPGPGNGPVTPGPGGGSGGGVPPTDEVTCNCNCSGGGGSSSCSRYGFCDDGPGTDPIGPTPGVPDNPPGGGPGTDPIGPKPNPPGFGPQPDPIGPGDPAPAPILDPVDPPNPGVPDNPDEPNQPGGNEPGDPTGPDEPDRGSPVTQPTRPLPGPRPGPGPILQSTPSIRFQ